MTLGDLENAVLTELQQPNASFVGGNPTWASNQQFSQGLVDFWINQAYIKVLGDLEDLELVTVTFTMPSLTLTSVYPIPAAGYAPISHVTHVQYQPFGLPYKWEYRPGQTLISWREYQDKWTNQGYLAPYAYGTQPIVCTVDPLLANLYFYPGSARAGDTITVWYAPLPANGATGCPTLVNESDKPLLPVDCHMAIFYFAMSRLWMRAREGQNAATATQMYGQELADIRKKYTLKQAGDVKRITPFEDYLGIGPF